MSYIGRERPTGGLIANSAGSHSNTDWTKGQRSAGKALAAARAAARETSVTTPAGATLLSLSSRGLRP